jgi:hypothetical protein
MWLSNGLRYGFELVETKTVSCRCPECGSVDAHKSIEVWRGWVYMGDSFVADRSTGGYFGDFPWEYGQDGYGEWRLVTEKKEVTEKGVAKVTCPECDLTPYNNQLQLPCELFVAYEDNRFVVQPASFLGNLGVCSSGEVFVASLNLFNRARLIHQ